MRISDIFTRTVKENPKDETSVNAKLLEKGGFVYKNSAGVYSFLPLGWRVIQKISNIAREEINAIGGQEMLMPSLVEKKYLDASGRWEVEVGYRVKGIGESEDNFVLGWTHEEVLTEIVSKFMSSYKDLPFAAYQIQTKFRNEPRAKSGILRGREFIMKDLYSFHSSENDLWRYYEEVKGAYHKIFHRCGLKSLYTLAAGGDFTVSNTHEFQVISSVGEDTILFCQKCDYAENAEISKLKSGSDCPKCKGNIVEEKSIEVGNIFPLGTKYSQAFNLNFTDEKGDKYPVVMGSYGIGISRVMGAIVEIHHDEAGIIWPETIAPFRIYLIGLEGVREETDKIYENLIKHHIEVLYDDRDDKTPGEKFADADLIGSPMRLVVSRKTLKDNSVEIKRRNQSSVDIVSLTKYLEIVK